MSIDHKENLPYVNHFDLTEDQKIELLKVISQIMKSFVDRAFGVDPVQLSLGKDFAAHSNPVAAHDTLYAIPHEETACNNTGGDTR